MVSSLQLDGPRGAIGRLVPTPDACRQVGLHVEGVRDARGRFDVVFRVNPAQGRAAKVFVKMNQFVVGAWVQWVDTQQGLIEGHRRQGAAETASPTGQLGPKVPRFLVVIVDRQETVERVNGRLFASLFVADAWLLALF